MSDMMPNPNDAPREVTNSATPRGYAAHRKTHPMLIIAAGAVTVFAAVGTGVMTGVIPSAHSLSSSKTESSMPTVPMAMAASAGIGTAGAIGGAAEGAVNSSIAPEADVKSVKSAVSDIKPIENKSIGQPLAKAAPASHRPAAQKANAPVMVASASPNSSNERATVHSATPTPVYAQNTQNSAAAPALPEPVICRTCGTIESVNTIAKQGEGSGAGAVLGGVLGGVIGHQVGNGRGKDLATVAGAVGGAVLGNSVEKNAKTAKSYDVRVRMEDGTAQTIRYETEPGVRAGDKVRVENGRILRG